MKKNSKKKFILKSFFLACLLIFSFSIVQSASAQALVPCGIGPGNASCTLCHLILGFKNIYDYLFKILLVATTVVIVVAGVMYMISSGDKGMLDKAKSALTYALTTIILALLAWLIINTVLNALGYNKSGSWWNFSCDTTQSAPQMSSAGPGGATLPAPGQRVANTTQGDGTCGGTKAIVEDKANCTRTSKALDDVLACIGKSMGTISASPANNIYSQVLDHNPFKINRVLAAGKLSIGIGIDYNGHVTNSCHYGGVYCQGQANAADLHGDLPTIRNAAISCGADSVISDGTAYFGGNSKSASDHTKHVHLSVNNAACGCDYMK
ncbi:MAG TPA: hypothetical protein VK254_04065 [Candidatus Bathyarchaeia archaeon]|nr:hypothetical protein [Candidatus Bathyarchaeia archaeon]